MNLTCSRQYRPRPDRRVPAFVWLAGALVLTLLAGCGSGGGCSSGSSGGSGYQIDGAPGLMACSTTSSGMNSTTGSTADTVVQGMAMTFNGSSLTSGTAVLLAFTPPTASAAANITGLAVQGGGTNTALSGSTKPYDVTVSGNAVAEVFCSLQGAAKWWWNTNSLGLPAAPTTYTLSVTYPMFTLSPAVLECLYLDTAGNYSNVATLSGTP